MKASRPRIVIDAMGGDYGPRVLVPGALKAARRHDLALKFVEFVLSEKGTAIMERNGQPSVVAAPSETYDLIPESLKKYATE